MTQLVVEGDLHLEQEVHVATGCPLVEMHVTNWAEAQREDQMLSTVLDWLKAQKKTDLKVFLAEHASREEGNLILHNRQNIAIHQGPFTPAQCLRQNWRSPGLHGPQGTLCCHPEWVPPRCGSSRVWPYAVTVAGMLLVAKDDQPSAAVHKILHVLLAAWG